MLSNEAKFVYKCSDFYHPEDEWRIRWDDNEIGIIWPLEESQEVTLSKNDLRPQPLKNINNMIKD